VGPRLQAGGPGSRAEKHRKRDFGDVGRPEVRAQAGRLSICVCPGSRGASRRRGRCLTDCLGACRDNEEDEGRCPQHRRPSPCRGGSTPPTGRGMAGGGSQGSRTSRLTLMPTSADATGRPKGYLAVTMGAGGSMWAAGRALDHPVVGPEDSLRRGSRGGTSIGSCAGILRGDPAGGS
jgi:hypothetical protein